MDRGNVAAIVIVLCALGAHSWYSEERQAEPPVTDSRRTLVPPKAELPLERPQRELDSFALVGTAPPVGELGAAWEGHESDWLDVQGLGAEIEHLADSGAFDVLAELLLQRAAQAVSEGHTQALAKTLSALGQLSMGTQDFDAAQVYLNEALAVYRDAGDETGLANVHLHLGRMHLQLRHRARVAGSAYDRLLLARWQLSAGQLQVAEKNLELTVEENLSINRFGAAAAAHRTLMQVYKARGDEVSHAAAAVDAAKLYAASGLSEAAALMVDELRSAGADGPTKAIALEREVQALSDEYQESVEQLARAEDYRRLYSHYQAEGDISRAWALRVEATRAAQKVGKRALYRRTPDVLAVLYASLDDVEKARVHLARAEENSNALGRDDLTAQAEGLRGHLY